MASKGLNYTFGVGAFMHADGPTKTRVSEERSLLLS